MTDLGNGAPPARPHLTIEFGGPGLAECNVHWTPDVTTGQVYEAAFVLDAIAHEMRASEVAGAARGLAAAPKGALDALDRLDRQLHGHDG